MFKILTRPFQMDLGVLLEKIEPDYFIRSSSRLIHIYPSAPGQRRTRRRPIYFATTPPPRLGPMVLDILRPIGLQAPDLEIRLVVPESRWDFSRRCFLIPRTSDEQSWGLVEFRIPKEQLQYASHDIEFAFSLNVVFETSGSWTIIRSLVQFFGMVRSGRLMMSLSTSIPLGPCVENSKDTR
jgi:hypothetical protein